MSWEGRRSGRAVERPWGWRAPEVSPVPWCRTDIVFRDSQISEAALVSCERGYVPTKSLVQPSEGEFGHWEAVSR